MKKSSALLKKLSSSLENEAPVPAAAPESAPRSRRTAADQIVYRAVPFAAAAALIPIPLLAGGAVAAVQIKLVHDLAGLYGVKFTDHAVKTVIASLGGFGVTAALSGGTAGLGTALSIAAAPVCSAAVTFAIGKTFAVHFESGGTLLKIDPAVMDVQFGNELAAASATLRRGVKDLVSELKP